MSLSNNFPTVAPSLLLDFANTKTIGPRVTFTRASTATYYDGTTFAKAEENLLIYSQEFDNAAWAKDRVTVSANVGATTAPDGTSTADKLIEDATTGTHLVYRSPLPVTAGSTYTFSVFLKAAERGFAFIRTNNAAFDAVTVNLTTGVAASANGSPTNIASTSAGGGWWRVSFTFTASTTSDWCGIMLSTDGVYANRSYAGDGTSGIYIWGAQAEQRSTLTAYQPTTATPVVNYNPQLLTAAANVARFDANPTTSESLGLLIEEQRTNLVTYSEQFDNVAWPALNATVSPNVIVSPSGSLTGYSWTRSSTASANVRQAVSKAASAVTYAGSFFAKRSIGNYIAMRLQGTYPNRVDVVFDLSSANGSISSAAAAFGAFTGASATITPVGNGWFRCSVVATSDTATTITSFASFNSNGTVVDGVDSASNSTGYLWGAQLEAGTAVTSYIPTVASQVTRSPDVATIASPNFTTWYNQGEGTLYAEGAPNRPYAAATGGQLFGVAASSASRAFIAQGNTTASGYAVIEVGSTVQVALGFGGASATGAFVKQAFAYKLDDFAASINASTVATDTLGSVPAATTAYIGGSVTGSAGGNWNGWIKKVAYYPRRLTNAQLQALTSG